MNSDRMYSILQNKEKHYKTFSVPKRNGSYRVITNPDQELKELQRDILDKILYNIKVDSSAHGFVPNKSIYTNARVHIKSKCVVSIDIKDFFPSISKDKVIASLMTEVSAPHAIAELITLKNCLPQGAPTSPYMANIVCINLDRQLKYLAKTFDARYTRYADDLTFSSKSNNRLDWIIKPVIKKVEIEGFKVHPKKIRVMRRGGRQIVTGLTVNDKVNVPRNKVRKFRAEIHQTEFTGTEEDLIELQQLMGYNSFIMGANKNKGKYYRKKIWDKR